MLLHLFDTNRDGVIDAQEIANAGTALKKLDKDGDGEITRKELRPPRPPRDGGRPAREHHRSGRDGHRPPPDDQPEP
jgi:hypothetical protein